MNRAHILIFTTVMLVVAGGIVWAVKTAKPPPGLILPGQNQAFSDAGKTSEEPDPAETPEDRTNRQERLMEQSRRYSEIMAEYRTAFVPPEPGAQITVKLIDGTVVEGALKEYADNNDATGTMTINTPTGEVTIVKKVISTESTVRYYTIDYLVHQTEKKMAEEFPDYKPPRNVFLLGDSGSPPPLYTVRKTEETNSTFQAPEIRH